MAKTASSGIKMEEAQVNAQNIIDSRPQNFRLKNYNGRQSERQEKQRIITDVLVESNITGVQNRPHRNPQLSTQPMLRRVEKPGSSRNLEWGSRSSAGKKHSRRS